MAIAFVAAGTRLKADTSVSGTSQNVALPAGHTTGHVIFLFVLTDANTNTTATPAGWTQLAYLATTGTATVSPYYAPPRLKIFYRADDGTLGSSVPITLDSSAWPGGKPYVLAFTAAYSGADTASPVERWSFFSDTATTVTEAHPQLTTSVPNDWLLTLRAVNTDDPPPTFTCSVGTDAERVDDNAGFPASPSMALYDSNAALTAGAQTQRSTTASRACTYGSIMVSIALKPAATASAAYATPGVASVAVSAKGATTTSTQGPWDLCSTGGLPDYSFLIDWNDDGLTATGNQLVPNPYVATDTSGWTATNATLARKTGVISNRVPVLALTTGSGAQPRIDLSSTVPVVAGQTYRVYGWLMAPAGLPSTASFSINWYDGANAYLSTSSNSKTLTAGQWTLFDATFTAPGSAAFASSPMSADGTPGAGLLLYGYGLMLIDPAGNAQILIPAPGEDALADDISDITITYGRDQDRQLSPAAVGSAAFTLINVDRQYSPEWSGSVLYGNLEPARAMIGQVTWAGGVLPLFSGRIDDFNVKVDRSDRTVDFTFLDALNDLSQIQISTPVYQAMRTGDLINVILDTVGWTAGRHIDVGATFVKYWWVEGTDALTAINDLVKSEGAPSIAYVAPDGSFVFHDRHHRIQNSVATSSQGTYGAGRMFDCTAPAVGGFDYTPPFTYAHGWREIVNSVDFDVTERRADTDLSVLWSTEDTINLSIGQSQEIIISGSDPFLGAVVPVAGTDYTATGAGTLQVTLDRTSGASATMTLIALGGAVNIQNLQVRGYLIPTIRNTKVHREDSGSISVHGARSYPDQAPWAGVNDAYDIAGSILLRYSQRRPTVQLRVVTKDPAHFVQILTRGIGDRIHIINGEMGLDDDFFIERITHTIQRVNRLGHPPVHAVVFGCEKALVQQANPFRFDIRGAGFDQGIFDPIQADSSFTTFVFDDPVRGMFDSGQYGT